MFGQYYNLNTMENIKLEYAIQNKDGELYNGNCYGDHRDWTKTSMDVFAYTEQRALHKMNLYPAMFGNCKVIRFV